MTNILKDGRRPGFYIVDNELIDHYGAQIGAYGIAVYNLLARYAGSGDTAFPSYKTIAEKLGMSRYQAIKTVNALTAAGLIVCKPRTDQAGDATSNIYTLVDLKGSQSNRPGVVNQVDYLVNQVDHGGQSGRPQVVNQVDPTKKQFTKTQTTKTKGKERGERGATKSPKPAPAPSAPTPQQVLFGKVCEVIGWDTKTLSDKDRAQVAQTVGILERAGYTVADLDQFWDTVWKMDWRWTQKHSRPSLTQLRQEIGKLRTKIEPTPTEQPNGYTNGRPAPMSKVEASLAAVDRVMARLDAEGGEDDGEE